MTESVDRVQTTVSGALNLALRHSLESNSKALILGQDVGRLGGVFRVTKDLLKDFGELRVLDSPLGEAGIIGTSIGMAMNGFSPICEIQFDGFVFPAFSQIVSQLARFAYRSDGTVQLPVVVRIPYGGGIGAIEHHSESPEAYFAQTPGLRVWTCSDPHTAYWGLRRAVEQTGPTIFFEPKRYYWMKGEIRPDSIGSSRVLRTGEDCTVVTYGSSVPTCIEAVSQLGPEFDVEIIELLSLSPIDFEAVFRSVRKTKRLLIVHEAMASFGIGSEISSRVASELFYILEAPVAVVAGASTPYPPARVEKNYLPQVKRITDAIEESMNH